MAVRAVGAAIKVASGTAVGTTRGAAVRIASGIGGAASSGVKVPGRVKAVAKGRVEAANTAY